MKKFVFECPETDPALLFRGLHDLPYSLWLDSADRAHEQGRYSFITATPQETIEAKDGFITITNRHQQTRFFGDPFTIAQGRLAAWGLDTETVSELPPFQGGLAGFFGYDIGRWLENITARTGANPRMPDMALGLYDQVIAFDHAQNKGWIIIHSVNEQEAELKYRHLLKIAQRSFPRAENSAVAWQALENKESYKAKIRRVIDYILEGDIFQANLAQHFQAVIPDHFNAFAHYLDLRHINPAPFAAYMNLGDVKISSASPERFLKLQERQVDTRPIKGTIRRVSDAAQDRLHQQMLLGSAKDRAENTMIVDLLRNDLSKVCLPDSVDVQSLCALESFASLHHLVSRVEGRLKPDKTAFDLLRACFPGGSITGAPKIRAMQIIEALEPERRGPYCGAMGYVGADGTMDMNILIRTITYQGQIASLQAGGGITAESDPEEEYQETMTKAANLLRSFSIDSERRAA